MRLYLQGRFHYGLDRKVRGGGIVLELDGERLAMRRACYWVRVMSVAEEEEEHHLRLLMDGRAGPLPGLRDAF